MKDESTHHITLSSLSTGERLVVRSKQNWRFAAVSRVTQTRVTLTVCSPGGRTYRLWRAADAEIQIEHGVPILAHSKADDWRANFCDYDTRW